MRPVLRPFTVSFLVVLAALVTLLVLLPRGQCAGVPQAFPIWRVEEVRRGMKGFGRTVMQGTRVETFQAEVLGVMKNTSPGRDLVLARLSGLGLEKSGVIAGMSGSPVYIEGKLLGAVAYAWAFGKEPIAGITPFCQMHSFVDLVERREGQSESRSARLQLDAPLCLAGKEFEHVTVAASCDDAPREGDGLFLMPLRTPLAATGFTSHSLGLLSRRAGRFGLTPMTGGATTSQVAENEKDAILEPGGPLAVALITGDFDLSGIGTVTHIENGRVYGWGHPFLSLGACGLPMMTGYIHTIYPRQTVSFKMGSPLREVGLLHADVSTCVAGLLGRKAEMLPVEMSVAIGRNDPRKFKVRVGRHPTLVPTLVYTALTNSVDMEGELPEEMTARLRATIKLENHPPITVEDTFSGFSGGRAPSVLYGQVSSVLSQLTFNAFQDLRIERVECDTHIEPGRATAEIESAALDTDTYCPGDTVTATVTLRPYKGTRRSMRLRLKLPVDLPPGSYSALLCDEPSSARLDVRGNPTLLYPANKDQLLEGVRTLLQARRTTLAMRLPIGAHGVATGGKALPELPGSMVQILVNSKRTGSMTMTRALVARESTDWVIQGAESLSFRVSKTRKVTHPAPGDGS